MSSRIRTETRAITDPNINTRLGRAGKDIRIHIGTFLDICSLHALNQTAKMFRGTVIPHSLDRGMRQRTTIKLCTRAARHEIDLWRLETRLTNWVACFELMHKNVRQIVVNSAFLDMIGALTQTTFPQCTSLTLVESPSRTFEGQPEALLRACPNLQELTIEYSIRDYRSEKAKVIAENCTHLTTLDCRSVPISPELLGEIFKSNPNLTAIKSDALARLIIPTLEPDRIEKLRTLHCSAGALIREEKAGRDLPLSKNLTELALGEAFFLKNYFLEFIAHNLRGLEVLRISGIKADGPKLVAAMQLLSKLRVLDISHNRWDDRTVIDVVAHLPALRELDISDNPPLTDECLLALAERLRIDKVLEHGKGVELDDSGIFHFEPAGREYTLSGTRFTLNLEKLALRGLHITAEALEAVLRSHETLKSLDLLDVALTVTHQALLLFSKNKQQALEINGVLPSLQNLTDLTIGRSFATEPSPSDFETSTDLLRALPGHLPNLARLYVGYNHEIFMSSDELRKTITQMPNLTELDVGSIYFGSTLADTKQFVKARPDVVVLRQ